MQCDGKRAFGFKAFRAFVFLMNPEIFREYDIRGIAERDLDSETAELIGKAYGTIIHNKGGKNVVVGRDNRKSGPRILKYFLKGLLSTGTNVIFIGEIPTPLLYYSVYKLDADGGVSITASHNPPEFNGFKAMVGKDAIYGDAIQEIRKIAESGKFATAQNGKSGKMKKKKMDAQYLAEIKSMVKIGRKLNIVIDSGNGMASELAPKLLRGMSKKLTCLYCKKIPSYPNHLPDPTEEKNILDLRKKVLSQKADMGIAFDGDADRIGVLDEKGNQIYGDKLLGLYAADLLKRQRGAKIIFEVKCSQGLSEWIELKGGKPMMWKTGHSLIKAKMKEEKAALAGEMSGHMFFTEKWYGFDDAILAAAKIIEIVSNSGKSVGELAAQMPEYASSPEYRVDFADSEKFAFIEKARKYFGEKYSVIDVDGVRVIFENGWALLRASNTQPKLILRFEGKTDADLGQIKERFLSEIASFSGIKMDLG